MSHFTCSSPASPCGGTPQRPQTTAITGSHLSAASLTLATIIASRNVKKSRFLLTSTYSAGLGRRGPSQQDANPAWRKAPIPLATPLFQTKKVVARQNGPSARARKPSADSYVNGTLGCATPASSDRLQHLQTGSGSFTSSPAFRHVEFALADQLLDLSHNDSACRSRRRVARKSGLIDLLGRRRK